MPQNSLAPTIPAEHSAQTAQEATQELQKIVDSSHEVLTTATTVFPFTFFPDTVTVDRTQVTITHRTFFLMGGVTSVRVEDILNVTAHVGPFFGSIKISTRFFDPDKPYQINYFWRQDALRLKALINGLVVATKKEIDASAVATPELVDGLTKLGQSTVDESP